MFLIQLFLLFSYSQISFALDVDSFYLSLSCAQKDKCSKQSQEFLKQASYNCELETQGLKCAEIEKSHPEWSSLMRRCDVKSLCQQNDDFSNEKRLACLRGFKNAMVDQGIGLKDMAVGLAQFVDGSWESFKSNLKIKDKFVHECDKSLACKRDLVKDDPRFQKLNDDQLAQRSALFLYTQTQRLRTATAPKSSDKSLTTEVTELSSDQLEKLQGLMGMVSDSVATEYTRYSCYHPAAKAELKCYAIGGVVDPLMVAGYFAKGARAVAATTRFAKGESEAQALRRASDKVKILEEVKDPKVAHSMRSRIVDSVPTSIANPPKGIRLVEDTNFEGKKIRYFQTREKLNDGTFVKSTREFQLDPLTGAINANFPAGRELFERLVKAKSGESHLAFIDVGSLGAVNKTFKAGDAAGDRYIAAVAEKIMKNSQGKITLARTGGDEFAILIDEKDPKKVQEILTQIRDELRMDLRGDGKQVFREEKIVRANAYKADPSEESLNKIKELAKIQQPDISIGSTQVGRSDSLDYLMQEAEEQAKQMKIDTALQFSRNAEKYGSKEIPRERPNSMFRANVPEPKASRSWASGGSERDRSAFETTLRDMKVDRIEEVKKVGNSSIVMYRDELGRESFKLERSVLDPRSGRSEKVSYEIPTRGQTKLLDGGHPESQNLVLEHFKQNADGVLVMPKLKSLRYLNYFESGTKAGDEMLEAVAGIVKKQTRHTDLSFKLPGADFLMSLDKQSAAEFARIQDRINGEILKNPKVISILKNERELINKKITAAKSNKNYDEAAAYQAKLRDLESFEPKIEIQKIERSEVNSQTSFEEIYKKFNKKFDP